MSDTNTEALMDDGENQAVRVFLMLYGCTSNVMVHDMCRHLAESGFDGYWPEWVADTRSETHLTKAGAQDWLRHLFSLETPPSLSVNVQSEREAFEAWYVKHRGAATGTAYHRIITSRLSPEGRYESMETEYAWDAWQARSALHPEVQVPQWECAVRKSATPEPQDCNWPVCGCDPYADKVIAALEESGAFRSGDTP